MEYQELHQEKYIVTTKRITWDTGKIHGGKKEMKRSWPEVEMGSVLESRVPKLHNILQRLKNY